jgi:sirohydrochlorin cobaltochelatase
MRNLTAALERWLSEGGERLGQILVRRVPEGWELRHIDDREREDLALHRSPEAARHLANADDAGQFRPLKTARNLAHGWRLVVADIAALHRALDYFYPAMLGCAESFHRGELPTIPLRTKLGRQTGMYRVTQQITDEQARAMIDRFCTGCLKQRLWEIAGPHPQPIRFSPGELPLLCHEACNLLVAEARKVVKGKGE